MTNSHEPSYYEIALTNRQVVVAFIILMVCLLTSFFSGVWIGRESAARNAEKLAANSGAPAGQEPEEGRSLEEFEFFEKPQAQGAAAQEEPAPAAERAEPAQGQDTTLLEDMGGEDEDFPPIEDEQETPPAAVTLPSPSPTASPVQRPTAEERRRARQERLAQQQGQQTPPPARPEDTVRPRPLPEASPRPATAAPAAPAATPAATPRGGGGGQVVIQVFSSPERDQAERIQKRLTSGGQKAFLSPVDVGGRTMYRVRIGPFATREAAQQVAEQVRKGYKLDTWVTE